MGVEDPTCWSADMQELKELRRAVNAAEEKSEIFHMKMATSIAPEI